MSERVSVINSNLTKVREAVVLPRIPVLGMAVQINARDIDYLTEMHVEPSANGVDISLPQKKIFQVEVLPQNRRAPLSVTPVFWSLVDQVRLERDEAENAWLVDDKVKVANYEAFCEFVKIVGVFGVKKQNEIDLLSIS